MTAYQKLIKEKRKVEQLLWKKKCALWKEKYPNGCFRVGVLRQDYYQVRDGDLKNIILLGISFDRNNCGDGFHISKVIDGKNKVTFKVEYGRIIFLDFVGRNYAYDTLNKAKLKLDKSGANELGELFDKWYALYNRYKNKKSFWEKYMGEPCKSEYNSSFEV